MSSLKIENVTFWDDPSAQKTGFANNFSGSLSLIPVSIPNFSGKYSIQYTLPKYYLKKSHKPREGLNPDFRHRSKKHPPQLFSYLKKTTFELGQTNYIHLIK